MVVHGLLVLEDIYPNLESNMSRLLREIRGFSMISLHKAVAKRNYLSGVRAVLNDRHELAEEFARSHPGTVYGWSDMDPHIMDIAYDGHLVARIEVHHNSEQIYLYDHPLKPDFHRLAESHGFLPSDKRPN